jgi:hypothetical protein
MTFDPSVTGLEKSIAFPLLISNATAYLLTQSESPATAQPEIFDPAESDIAPRPVPNFESVAPAPSPTNGATDIWPLFLTAALFVLGAEWLAFGRRG